MSDNAYHDLQDMAKLTHHAQHVMINTGELAIQLQRAEEITIRDPDRSEQMGVPVATWTFPETLPDTVPLFNTSDWPTLQTWNQSLQQGERIYFWSWYQLYADYGIATGNAGPWYDRRSLRWQESTSQPGTPAFVRRC